MRQTADDMSESGAPSLDTARFRQVLGHFATGVSVVTTHDGKGPVGFTCQSFMSLSLDPPLVAFSPSKTSDTWPRIEAVGFACVNFLEEGQEDIARVFATKGDGKFEGVGFHPGMNGAPILTGAIGWVEGYVHQVHDAGDHWICILAVSEVGEARGRPLLFFRGGFGSFES